MVKFLKTNNLICLISFFCIVGFVGSSLAASIGTMQIIPEGKVYVYNGDQKIAELTAESPIPQGKILKVDGRCGVKLDSLYLVATDKSALSIRIKKSGQEIFVRKGKIYFGITDISGPITLFTPKGGIVAQQVILKTSSQPSMLEGYIDVSEKIAEIGVTNGGAMIISTADGEITISKGERFLLAQAQVPVKASVAAKAASGVAAAGQLSGGTLAAILGTIAVAPVAIGNIVANSSTNRDTVSPKQ